MKCKTRGCKNDDLPWSRFNIPYAYCNQCYTFVDLNEDELERFREAQIRRRKQETSSTVVVRSKKKKKQPPKKKQAPKSKKKPKQKKKMEPTSCKQHPKYMVKRKPRSGCKQCWKLYENKFPEKAAVHKKKTK